MHAASARARYCASAVTRDHARPTRRQFLVGASALGGAAVGLSLLGGDAPWLGPPAVPLIGYVSPRLVGHDAATEAFREGLREYGLVEGENISVEWRFGAGQPERLPALVAELLELGVRMVVTSGGTPAQAARRVTDRVPIVMIEVPDPVAAGWAASYARPGGNVTGIRGVIEGTTHQADRAAGGDRAESASPGLPPQCGLTAADEHQAVADAAARAGLELLVVQVETEAHLEPAVEQARTWGADLLTALYVIPLNVPVERLPTLVRRARLPASGRGPVDGGGPPTFLRHRQGRSRTAAGRGTWRASWAALSRASCPRAGRQVRARRQSHHAARSWADPSRARGAQVTQIRRVRHPHGGRTGRDCLGATRPRPARGRVSCAY